MTNINIFETLQSACGKIGIFFISHQTEARITACLIDITSIQLFIKFFLQVKDHTLLTRMISPGREFLLEERMLVHFPTPHLLLGTQSEATGDCSQHTPETEMTPVWGGHEESPAA